MFNSLRSWLTLSIRFQRCAVLRYLWFHQSDLEMYVARLASGNRIPNMFVAISATLHEEISPLGLKSVCFDFGYFRTALLTEDNRAPRTGRIADYNQLTERWETLLIGKDTYHRVVLSHRDLPSDQW